VKESKSGKRKTLKNNKFDEPEFDDNFEKKIQAQ